jgi:hypothetical protein
MGPLKMRAAPRGCPVSKRLNRSGEGDDDPTILEATEVAKV